MRRPYVVVVVLWLFAGCLTPSPEIVDDRAAPAAPLVPSFLNPIALAAITPTQGEFPLEVTDDGTTILTCTHGAFTGPAPKFASEDGGTTWRPLAPAPPTGISGDCWVDIGDDGTWYFIDSQVGANTVSSTRDKGRTWIVNRLATPPIGGTVDRPYLAPLGGASMALTYVQAYLAPGFVVFTRTDDHGATWTPPVRISAVVPTRTNVMHGPMVVTENGTVVRVPLFQFSVADYPTMNPARGTLGFATSRDKGVSWSYDPVLEQVEALFTPPAVAASGANIYWAYQVETDNGQDLMLVVSRDAGKTWDDPKRVVGGWDYLGYVWIDPAPDGGAVIAFDADAAPLEAGTSGEHLILLRLHAEHDSLLEWALAVASAENAEFSTVAHDAAGRLHASYRRAGEWLFIKESR